METVHWAEDRYWTEALDRYYALKERGQTTVTLDLQDIERRLFDGGSPAYRLVEAMCSVKEHEGYDGHRGAPRLVLALLALLSESDGAGEEIRPA